MGGETRAGQQEVVEEKPRPFEVWASEPGQQRKAAFWGAELGPGMRGSQSDLACWGQRLAPGWSVSSV